MTGYRTVCFSGHRRLHLPEQADLFADTREAVAAGALAPWTAGQDMLADLPPEERELYAQIASQTAEVCARLYEQGARRFLCGMAEGFDLLAGALVAGAKRSLPGVSLTAVIPFPAQAQAFGESHKRLYEQVLGAADDRVVISPAYSRDCFHRRNDYMVEHAQALVCCFDGSPGGTAYTVKAAVKRGLNIYNVI